MKINFKFLPILFLLKALESKILCIWPLN